MADYKPEELFAKDGLMQHLAKAVLERALDAEMTEHLGYEKGAPVPSESRGNSRNASSRKTLKSEHGDLELRIPRDRSGSFEPQIVPKHQTRLPGSMIKSSQCTHVG